MSEDRTPTTERLAIALVEAGGPQSMIDNARGGRYDDYKCEISATPCIDLVRDLRAYGLFDLSKRAMNGEFDSKPWESAAWSEANKNDPELGPLLKIIEGMKP